MSTEKIESLITQIVQGNTAEAEQTFNQIISQKASSAIENMRDDVTDRMFAQGQYHESVEIQEGGMGGAYGVGDPRVKEVTDKLKAGLAKSGITMGKTTSIVRTKDAKGNVVTKKTVTKG